MERSIWLSTLAAEVLLHRGLVEVLVMACASCLVKDSGPSGTVLWAPMPSVGLLAVRVGSCYGMLW